MTFAPPTPKVSEERITRNLEIFKKEEYKKKHPPRTRVEDPSIQIQFLQNLDDLVHEIHYDTLTPNMSGGSIPISYHSFNELKILPEAIEMVLNIVKQEELILRPSKTGIGGIIFEVIYAEKQCAGTPTERKSVLAFEEYQLPKGYNFDKLSKVFLSERNIELAEFFGLGPIKRDRKDYT